MKKSQLKQLIKEVIQEIDNRPDRDVDIDLSKLGKGLTGKLKYVPINYVHTRIEYYPGEEPSMDSPGHDEEFYFEVTYTANDDTFDSNEEKLVLKAGEQIPQAAIDPAQVEEINDDIIEKFIDDSKYI
jgi:hypothetical protein